MSQQIHLPLHEMNMPGINMFNTTLESFTNSWKKYFFKYVLIVFPIFVQFLFICKYSLNIPRYDDYDSIIELVTNFQTTAFPGNIYHLFDQHIEHRIFTTRLVSVLYYKVFGNINFRGLIFFNFFLAVLLFGSLIHVIRKIVPRYWHYVAIVVSLCCFDMINTENSNWAMSGIQNYGVTLFFISSMILYGRNGKGNTIAAFLLQVLCIYTSGNGHVASLFIVIYNLFSGSRKKFVISLLTMLVFSSLYYYHYNSVNSTFTDDMEKVLPFFLHAVGSHFSFDYGIPAGVVILVIFFALLGREIIKLPRLDKTILPLLCIAGYAIASQVLMSFFRGNLPVVVSYSSRYIGYSHLLLIVMFTYLVFRIEKDNFSLMMVDNTHRARIPLIPIVIIICSISYLYNYDDGKKAYEGMHHILATERYYFPDSVKAKRITDDACRLKIYCIENQRIELTEE